MFTTAPRGLGSIRAREAKLCVPGRTCDGGGLLGRLILRAGADPPADDDRRSEPRDRRPRRRGDGGRRDRRARLHENRGRGIPRVRLEIRRRSGDRRSASTGTGLRSHPAADRGRPGRALEVVWVTEMATVEAKSATASSRRRSVPAATNSAVRSSSTGRQRGRGRSVDRGHRRRQSDRRLPGRHEDLLRTRLAVRLRPGTCSPTSASPASTATAGRASVPSTATPPPRCDRRRRRTARRSRSGRADGRCSPGKSPTRPATRGSGHGASSPRLSGLPTR